MTCRSMKDVLAKAIMIAEEHGAIEIQSLEIQLPETGPHDPGSFASDFQESAKGTIAEEAELIFSEEPSEHSERIVIRDMRIGKL